MAEFDLLVAELARALDEAADALRAALGGRPQKMLASRISNGNTSLVSRWLSGSRQLYGSKNRLPGRKELTEVAQELRPAEPLADLLVALGGQIDDLRGQLDDLDRAWRSKARAAILASDTTEAVGNAQADTGDAPAGATEGPRARLHRTGATWEAWFTRWQVSVPLIAVLAIGAFVAGTLLTP